MVIQQITDRAKACCGGELSNGGSKPPPYGAFPLSRNITVTSDTP